MNSITHNVALELSQLLYSNERSSSEILWDVALPILKKANGCVPPETLQDRVWKEICTPKMEILKKDYVREYSHNLRQFFTEAQMTLMVKECKEHACVQGWRSSLVLSLCYLSACQNLKRLMVEKAESMTDSIKFEIEQLLIEDSEKKTR